jgi:hypothetical protein
VVACLGPFLDKAFHIDDPLFLMTARQIQSRPLDFYGFTVNWYGTAMPMWEVTKNPPLTAYYIAVVAACAGWSEIAIHLAFIVPAVAAALGTYSVAGRFGAPPLLAALVAVLTPAFLVSGTTVMCDTMMLALWVWAVVLWVRGLDTGSRPALVLAAVLVALCSLTKYYGMSLIPLLFVYGAVRVRRVGWWAACLLIPVAVLALYQGYTHLVYGRGLLLDASAYAVQRQADTGAGLVLKTLSGLAFVGGGFLPVAGFVPVVRLWRWLAAAPAVAALLVVAVVAVPMPPAVAALIAADSRVTWPFLLQAFLLAGCGVALLATVAADLWHRRDADSLLLGLWIAGTFVFAAYINWSVNARSVLPMAPALGIVAARVLGTDRARPARSSRWRVAFPVGAALALSLAVAWADGALAGSARIAADRIRGAYADRPGRLRFQGHWGFQYYMELTGRGGNWQPLDERRLVLDPGDVVVIPSNNTNRFALPAASFALVDVVRVASAGWLATMSVPLGAGFYADAWGPLPFAVGAVPHEEYYVLAAARPMGGDGGDGAAPQASSLAP